VDEQAIRDMLDEEQRRTLSRIGAMSGDFDGIVAGSVGSNSDDEHDPEGSTIAFERTQVGALLRDARAYFADLDGAVARLNAGTYGTCERCGRPIAPERLAARPAARACIACTASADPVD